MNKTYLFVINDAPYGSERPYKVIRHVMNIETIEISPFCDEPDDLIGFGEATVQ